MIVKIIAVLLAGCLGFSACGSGGADTSVAATTKVITEAVITTVAPTTEATTTEVPTTEDVATTEETTKEAETETQEETKAPETTKRETEAVKVWITKKGKKYHSDPDCSNMKAPWQVTIDEAEDLGRGPCSKCY